MIYKFPWFYFHLTISGAFVSYNVDNKLFSCHSNMLHFAMPSKKNPEQKNHLLFRVLIWSLNNAHNIFLLYADVSYSVLLLMYVCVDSVCIGWFYTFNVRSWLLWSSHLNYLESQRQHRFRHFDISSAVYLCGKLQRIVKSAELWIIVKSLAISKETLAI